MSSHTTSFHRQASLAALLAFAAILSPLRAQTTVYDYEGLANAINAAALDENPSTITFGNNITVSGLTSAQLVINANITIDGGGYYLDMSSIDRAFFIAGGNVTIQDLTIQNGNATGGTGYSGGGGGAGLGGAIFIGSGSYSGWVTSDGTNYTSTVVASGISAPVVSLNNVSFSSNSATGGSAQIISHSGSDGSTGGGGGMGGSAGTSSFENNGSGGGGFGNDATGGLADGSSGNAGSAGAFTNVAVSSGASTSGGVGGDGGGAGGVDGGGGGSGNFDNNSDGGAGGGGGVGGMRGFYQNSGTPNSGGYGGFGGGGGGGSLSAGDGGFGGGGGGTGSYDGDVGDGGFGGGGGGVWSGSESGGTGGFGAGHGTNEEGGGGGGGGGLGAGGAVFVMDGATLTISGGSFSSNSTTAGSAYHNGSAYGDDIFLGADVTFDVSQGNFSLTNLGGAGNTSDSNVIAADPNAQGGLTVTGGIGSLTLNGTANYYTGATVVDSGILALASGASETGTSTVTVGQDSGGLAALTLGAGSSLTLGANATLGTTGSFGVAIGAGSTGSVYLDSQAAISTPGSFTIGQGNGATASVILSDNATLDAFGTFTIAQDGGSTGYLQIGSGSGTAGAYLGVQTITGGLGQASLIFRQSYAFGSSSNMTYNFESTLTGFLDLVQYGEGTTLLLPQFGDNTFSGSVTVDSGALATASSGGGAALAGISSLIINGGTFSAGQSDGINDDASLLLNGGTFSVAADGLNEVLGAFSITADSVLDFASLAADLTFASLSIGAKLQIWNYDASLDTITIFDATASGDLSRITFYSDDGQTLLGSATLNGDSLDVVPEPSTIALLALSLALGVLLLARHRHTPSR